MFKIGNRRNKRINSFASENFNNSSIITNNSGENPSNIYKQGGNMSHNLNNIHNFDNKGNNNNINTPNYSLPDSGGSLSLADHYYKNIKKNTSNLDSEFNFHLKNNLINTSNNVKKEDINNTRLSQDYSFLNMNKIGDKIVYNTNNNINNNSNNNSTYANIKNNLDNSNSSCRYKFGIECINPYFNANSIMKNNNGNDHKGFNINDLELNDLNEDNNKGLSYLDNYNIKHSSYSNKRNNNSNKYIDGKKRIFIIEKIRKANNK